MSCFQNLVWAESAILHVNMMLPRGAGNKYEDVYRSKGQVNQDKVESNRKLIHQLKWMVGFKDAVHQVCTTRKMGNCGEQSLIAYHYLLDHTAATDMAVLDFPGWNHVFVVIGGSRLADCFAKTVRFDTAPDLGPDAVVCDPWYNVAYEVKEWPNFMPQTLRETLWGGKPPETSRANVTEFLRR